MYGFYWPTLYSAGTGVNCQYLQNKNVFNCCLKQLKEMSDDFKYRSAVKRSSGLDQRH